jgi:hypothetical protein
MRFVRSRHPAAGQWAVAAGCLLRRRGACWGAGRVGGGAGIFCEQGARSILTVLVGEHPSYVRAEVGLMAWQ